MSLIAIILILVLEQWAPFRHRDTVNGWLTQFARLLQGTFDAGERQHGVTAWLLAVLPIVLGGWIIYAVAAAIHPVVGFVVNVAALYVTMGFRQASHHFTGIHEALKAGDLEAARHGLAVLRGGDYSTLGPGEISRLAIEAALVGSHRHVFAVMFWFVVLPGPVGALLYRVTEFLDGQWGSPRDAETAFGAFARKAFRVVDWLPERFSALAFAIVGDFEDAVYCWRTQAAKWPEPADGLVLATGAGAMGVRLGLPVERSGMVEERPEIGLGDDADVVYLDTTVGLVWRALVLWLAILLLIAIASIVG